MAAITHGYPQDQVTYQSPNLEYKLFDVDAISLEGNDRTQVVDALGALASNFNDNGLVDSDLREKALAIALRLDGLNGVARQAHEALSNGLLPEKLDYLTSTAKIASVLWNAGEKLSNNVNDPADQTLAPFLMELALAIDPAPQNDQALAYSSAAKNAPLPWKKIVTLSPGGPSDIRVRQLVAGASVPLPKKPVIPKNPVSTMIPKPGPGALPEPIPKKGSTDPFMEPAPDLPKPAPSSIKLDNARISTVAMVGETPIAGSASLRIREPDETEQSLFGLFGGDATENSFEMKLLAERNSPVEISEFKKAESLVRRSHPIWPDNRIAALDFTPVSPITPQVTGKANLSLPIFALLHSAFSGEPINPNMAVVSVPLGKNPPSAFPKDIIPLLMAADALSEPVLLIPGEAQQAIEDALLLSDDPIFLVRPQLLAVESREDYELFLSAQQISPKITEAIESFSEIEALMDKEMSLRDIATNEVVRSRLEDIVESCPNHLSAKLMLKWGDPSSLPEGLTLTQSITLIVEAFRPVQEALDDELDDNGSIVPDVDELVTTSEANLRKLRENVDPSSISFLNATQDALSTVETYLSLTNRSTSIGAQRKRELNDALEDMESARKQLEQLQ